MDPSALFVSVLQVFREVPSSSVTLDSAAACSSGVGSYSRDSKWALSIVLTIK